MLIHSKFEVKLPFEESIEFFVTSIQKALTTSKQQVCEWPIYGRIMWKCPTQLEVIEQVLPVGQKVKQLPAQAQRAKKVEEGQKRCEGGQKPSIKPYFLLGFGKICHHDSQIQISTLRTF